MKRSKFLFVVLLLVVFLAIGHTIFHFYVWGTGIAGFSETGISGLNVGNFEIGEEATGIYSIDSSISQIFVVLEWLVVFMFLITAFVRGRVNSKKEVGELKIAIGKIKGPRETDLDKLYHLLKERKKVSFGPIARVFSVDRGIVQDWAKVLESGKLATINYPRIGDPVLVLEEKNKK